MKFFLMALVAVFGLCGSVSGRDVLSALPGDTKLVARIDLNQLRENKFYQQIEDANLDKYEQFQQMMVMLSGIDIEQIEKAWIAGKEKEQGLVVLEGKFDPARITAAVSMHQQIEQVKLDNCPLAVKLPDQKRPGEYNLAALLNNSVLVVGRPEYLKEFVKIYGTAKQKGLDKEKLEKARGFFENKAVCRAFLLDLPKEMRQNFVFANVKSGEGILTLGDDLCVELKLITGNVKEAAAYVKLLESLIVLRKDNNRWIDKPGAKQLFDNLKIENQGQVVLLSSKISAALIEKMINSRIGN
jgi:hypothetical protein